MAELLSIPATEEDDRDGAFILWTLALIAFLSRLTEQDVVLASDMWTRLAPVNARGLIHARPVRGTPTNVPPATIARVEFPPSAYRWNEDLYRYVGPAGRTISPGAVKQSFNTFVANAQTEIAGATGAMNVGETSIAEWQQYMAQHVKQVHVLADVVAQGGWLQLQQLDVKRIETGVEFHLRKLLTFAREVSARRVSELAAIARAKMYAGAALTAYEGSVYDTYRRLALTGVLVEMRNILGNAEHCEEGPETPGCLNEANRGWVGFGTMSLPGRRTCRVNCKCRLAYREALG